VVERQHEAGLRPIDEEAGRALRGAGLKETRQRILATRPDREDRADRNVVLQIG
jgi:hypothetical protein